jgi:hypothetical protein
MFFTQCYGDYMKQYVTIAIYVRTTREMETKFWLERYWGNTGDDRGLITRVGQWGWVELAHNEIIEGNDSRVFLKLSNF